MTIRLERPLLLVGCGKMGSALLTGWLDSGIAAGGVAIVEPGPGGERFAREKGITVVASPGELAADFAPETVVFAVKPQQMDAVVRDYRRFAGPGCLFLSIAAGTPIRFFEQAFGADCAIVRAMPNTPAAIGQGITVACANRQASARQKELALALLKAVGETHLVDDEALIDPVTAVSGGGPAYVFLLIECLAEAGVEAGLPAELAARLALVTVAGAGQLALGDDAPPAELRRNVTSPGGTTQEALKVLMDADGGLGPLMKRAIAAATARSRELAG